MELLVLADDYFRRQNFSLLQVNLQKNSFTCKWSDNFRSSKIVEKTCSSIPALIIVKDHAIN